MYDYQIAAKQDRIVYRGDANAVAGYLGGCVVQSVADSQQGVRAIRKVAHRTVIPFINNALSPN